MAEDTSPRATMTAKGRYETLKSLRDAFLKRARLVASLTIPGLMPPEGHTGTTELPQPYQSLGARGINNLAAKLLLALFPPGSSFFRLAMDDAVVDAIQQQAGGGQDGEDARSEFEEALGKVERAIVKRMEQNGSRAPLFEALKQLLACGNVLIEMLGKGRLRFHRLDSYVIKRDPDGNVLDIVVLQRLSRMSVPAEVQQILDEQADETPRKDKSGDDVVELYTRITRAGARWEVRQECCDKEVPGSFGTYPLDESPWIPLRFTRIDGEDYGRGMGEEYAGDLISYESLSQSIVELAAGSAKALIFVDEAGVTSREDVARASNLDVVSGRAAEVTSFQLEKSGDFSVAFQVAQNIEKRLEQAFLLLSGVQRNAERVTAEEIRLVANELEQSLGGVYSLLAEELQLPLVRRLLLQMQKEKSLPSFPKGAVNPSIVTGMEALGRGSDLQRLDMLVQGLETLFGPDAAVQWIDVGAYLKRRATAIGIDPEGLVRDGATVQQMQQAQAVKEMAPDLLKSAQAQQDQQQQATDTQ